MSKRKLLKYALTFLGITISCLILYQLYLDYLPEIKLLFHFHGNYQQLIAMIRSHGPGNMVLVFVLNAICVAIPGVSNGIFCVLNGILYGPTLGFIINWISDILGQLLLLSLIEKIYSGPNIEHSKFSRLLQNQPYPEFAFSLGYAIPFIPSITVSFASLLVNKSLTKKIIPIIVGSIPLAFLYAYGGDSLLHLNGKRLIATIAILIFIALIALLVLFYGYHKNKKTAAE